MAERNLGDQIDQPDQAVLRNLQSGVSLVENVLQLWILTLDLTQIRHTVTVSMATRGVGKKISAMNNPWLQFPTDIPRLLASDQPAIDAFNAHYIDAPEFTIQSQLLPEPFIGDPQAPVYVLGLNPGIQRRTISGMRSLNSNP